MLGNLFDARNAQEPDLSLSARKVEPSDQDTAGAVRRPLRHHAFSRRETGLG